MTEKPRPTDATLNDPALSYVDIDGKFQAVYCPETGVFAMFMGPADFNSCSALVAQIMANTDGFQDPLAYGRWVQHVRGLLTSKIVKAEFLKLGVPNAGGR